MNTEERNAQIRHTEMLRVVTKKVPSFTEEDFAALLVIVLSELKGRNQENAHLIADQLIEAL